MMLIKERIETLEALVSNIREEVHTLVKTMHCMMETMHLRQEVPLGNSNQTLQIHSREEAETERANFTV